MSRRFLRVSVSPVIALAALLVASVCLGIAAILLRRLGTGYRIARLLASAPEASLTDAALAASAADRHYLRVRGRITSDEEFPDENQRPLVFRRRRLERAGGRDGWTVIGEDRQAVAFGVEDRMGHIAIDAEALGDGLVVVPRESTGLAGELPSDLLDRLQVRLDPTTRVRLRIDQLSAVEHATVAGSPVTGPDGPMITAGTGRPLIVSTLETPAAMRLLAGERRGMAVAAAVAIVVGLGSVAVAAVALVAGW